MRTATIPQADPTLTPQMNGEHTRLACWFRRPRRNHLCPTSNSVSGALTDARAGAGAPHCSLEIGRSGLGGDGKPWRIGTEVYGDRDLLPRDGISRKLSVPIARPTPPKIQSPPNERSRCGS